MDLNYLVPVLTAVAGFFLPKLWALVISFVSGDLEKGLKVALAALDEAQSQFPEAFDNPNVFFVPYVEQVVRSALEKKDLNIDASLVVAEVLKKFGK
jgi:hypothetical protein